MIQELNKKLQAQFEQMQSTGKLFRVNIPGQELWDLYLNSFPKEYNQVFRSPESSEHNCNHCKNFMRRYANIVSIDENYNIQTIFDVEIEGEYENSIKALIEKIKKAKIENVFFETYDELHSLPYGRCKKGDEQFALGVAVNHKVYTEEEAKLYGRVEANKAYTFNHLHLSLFGGYVDTSGKSVESVIADYRDSKNVFKRLMDEVSLDTFELVRDLIYQDSLLNGKSYLDKLNNIIKLKKEFDLIPPTQRENWCWVKSYKLPYAKFRNELIGTLCVELTEGEDLNKACLNWNKRADPTNYMKVSAPITAQMIKEAQKFVEENGYEESFNRRHATIDDIKVSEIFHVNVGDGKVKKVSLFDSIKPSVSTKHKRSEFEKVEEVPIDTFMKDILPNCTSLELFLEGKHEKNLMNLTTSANNGGKPLFKYNNNFAVTFSGNIAGASQIAQNVKTAGGKIEAILRCSLQWNDEDTKGIVDYDLHCRESKGSEIYYSDKRSRYTKGELDVDMIRPSGIGIENITWQVTPKDMEYNFFVRNFCGGRNSGFKVEIAFEDNVFNYHYKKSLATKEDVKVATVKVKNGVMTIEHHLIPTNDEISKEMYGLQSNQFHKVNLVCLSPNFWESEVGNKHYIFALEGCRTNEKIRSFHNEFLNSELLQHRKVMDVLANTTMIEPTDEQLAGLGFNATVRDEIIVKCKGSHQRILKIKI